MAQGGEESKEGPDEDEMAIVLPENKKLYPDAEEVC